MFSIYLLRRVLCFRGTYKIILTFFSTYMVQNQQKTYNLDPIMPFQTNIVVDMDILIFRYPFLVLCKNEIAIYFAKQV